MFEERRPDKQENEQEIFIKKIARVRGIYNIDRLILALRRGEENEPVFQQYLEEKEAEREKK